MNTCFLLGILITVISQVYAEKEIISAIPLEDLKAGPQGLVVKSEVGYSLPISSVEKTLSSLTEQDKFFERMEVSANGSVVGVECTSTDLFRVFEWSIQGTPNTIVQLPLSEWNYCLVLPSADGKTVWLLDQHKATIVNVSKKEVVRKVESQKIDLVESNQYAVLGDKLLVAERLEEGVRLTRLDSEGHENGKELLFRKAGIFRILVHSSGDLIIAGRNESNSDGFLLRIDPTLEKTIWSDKTRLPFHLCFFGNDLLVTDGSNIAIVDAKTGKGIGEIKLKGGLYRIASDAKNVWALRNDRKTVLEISNVERFISGIRTTEGK